MAKTIKAKKAELLVLLSVINRAPADKLAANVDRYISCRKAVKKPLKTYLDAEADLADKIKNELAEFDRRYLNQINDDIATLNSKPELSSDDRIKKTGIERQRTGFFHEKQKIANSFSDKLAEAQEPMKKQSAEIVFDNEDYLFLKNLIKDNAGYFFQIQNGDEKRFDADSAEKIFDLLDKAE